MSPRRELMLFLSALGFLTRLPVPAWVGWAPGRLAAASRYFVLAGAAIGAAGGAGLLVRQPCPAGCAGRRSGARGADLADRRAPRRRAGRLRRRHRGPRPDADARDHARQPGRRLWCLGAHLLGGPALVALAVLGPCTGALALVIGGGIGRFAMVPATAYWHYVREGGAGDDIAEGAGIPEIALAFGTALVLALIGGWAGLVALIIAGGLCAIFLVRIATRLGGYTGDVLGASAQIGEIAVLIVLAGAWA